MLHHYAANVNEQCATSALICLLSSTTKSNPYQITRPCKNSVCHLLIEFVCLVVSRSSFVSPISYVGVVQLVKGVFTQLASSWLVSWLRYIIIANISFNTLAIYWCSYFISKAL